MTLLARTVTACLAFVGAIVVLRWLVVGGMDEMTLLGRLGMLVTAAVFVLAIGWAVVR